MSDVKLGTMPIAGANRDAIHIAVAPVTCDSVVRPGQHVALAPGCVDKVHVEGEAVGIVDPFLLANVPVGTPFWLVLYPQTITSLRHAWTHPAFVATVDAVAVSKAWLADIASRCGVSYDRMMGCVANGDYIETGENEAYKSVLDPVHDEFKRHCEVVLGRTFKHAPYPFSCSC